MHFFFQLANEVLTFFFISKSKIACIRYGCSFSEVLTNGLWFIFSTVGGLILWP